MSTTDEGTLRVQCPHCGVDVEAPDSLAGEDADCPNCGRPFQLKVPQTEVSKHAEDPRSPTYRVQGPRTEEQTLHVAHPAIARRRPFSFFLLMVALVAGAYGLLALGLEGGVPFLQGADFGQGLVFWVSLGLVVVSLAVLGVWWITTRFHSLAITNKRSVYKEGIISRETSEVLHDDVRNLQVDQSVIERIFGVGDLAISSAGQGDMEIVIRAIPRPNDVAEMIRKRQH